MVPLWIIFGLILSGVSVSTLGAFFSIKGLGALFSGAMLAIWIMAGSLELSKFVLAAYLHRQWKIINKIYRTYLVSSVVILSLITSMGIFGFLSDAYQSASSVLQVEDMKLRSLNVQLQSAQNEVTRLNRSLDEIPANRITKRIQTRKELEPQFSALARQIDQVNSQIAQAQLTILDAKKKVGPLIYISKAFDVDVDVVVKYLILVLVSVFDPLAICLVIAISEALASRGRPQIQAEPTFEQKPLTQAQASPASGEEILQMQFADDSEKNAG